MDRAQAKVKAVVMTPWTTLERREIIQPEGGRFLKVEYHRVELPNGQIIDPWPWVVMPNSVNVVVMTKEDTFVCMEQTKYAVEGASLSVVGGLIEQNENAEDAARRELLEEIGYVAIELELLGLFAVDGNRGGGIAHCFLARNAYPITSSICRGDLEFQEIRYLSRVDIHNALLAGKFKVLPWATAVSLALLKLSLE